LNPGVWGKPRQHNKTLVSPVVGGIKQRDGAPKLLGRKFIKQAGSDLADLSPKAEPQEQRGSPYISFRAGYRSGGYSLSHTWPHIISLAILTSGVR
jgi:hypothetical protein